MKNFMIAVWALSFVSLPFEVRAENIAITGGTAHTMSEQGIVGNATILVSDGKIQSVEAGGDVPDGYRVVDAVGKWITPGLMVSLSGPGVFEVPLKGSIVEGVVKKADNALTLDITHGLNPDSVLFGVTRLGGITRASVGFLETGDIWLGKGAVIHLGGGFDIVSRAGAFVGLDISDEIAGDIGGGRAIIWQKLLTAIEKAKPKDEAEGQAGESSENGEGDQKKSAAKPQTPADKLMQKMLSGDVPVVVTAHSAMDILRAISLKTDHGFNVVVRDGEEAWRVADRLAEAEVPVILNAMDNLPVGFEMLAATQKNAARLHKAGVKVALLAGNGSQAFHNARLVRQQAGVAVAHGLPWDAAMAGITTIPARIFGVDDVYGAIKAGLDADIVLWDGDPLEVMTMADTVFVRGVETPMESRQTKLRDRYLSLEQNPAYDK